MIGSFFWSRREPFRPDRPDGKAGEGAPCVPQPCQERQASILQISAAVTNRLAKASV